MDSDVIRHEIDKTTDRIHERLELLADRTYRAKRTVSIWFAVAVTAAGAIAAIVLGRRHVRQSPVRRTTGTIAAVGAPRRTDMRAAR